MTHSYSQHRFEHATNTRRTLGIAMVVLVHVVAIVAIINGTRIVDVITKHEMHVTVMTPEMPTPPAHPVEVKNSTGVGLTIDTRPPVVNSATNETTPVVETSNEVFRENTSATATQAARIDPKHPLT